MKGFARGELDLVGYVVVSAWVGELVYARSKHGRVTGLLVRHPSTGGERVVFFDHDKDVKALRSVPKPEGT